jgi:hypothetical protein
MDGGDPVDCLVQPVLGGREADAARHGDAERAESRSDRVGEGTAERVVEIGDRRAGTAGIVDEAGDGLRLQRVARDGANQQTSVGEPVERERGGGG